MKSLDPGIHLFSRLALNPMGRLLPGRPSFFPANRCSHYRSVIKEVWLTWKRGMIQIPVGRFLFPDMTVMENLGMGACPACAKTNKKEKHKNAFISASTRIAGRRF